MDPDKHEHHATHMPQLMAVPPNVCCAAPNEALWDVEVLNERAEYEENRTGD